MSQSNAKPAAGNVPPSGSSPTGATTAPPAPPPFNPKGAQVGSVVSRLGPLLLIVLLLAVVAIFYFKSKQDEQALADDILAGKIAAVPAKNLEAPKRIDAYEQLLKDSTNSGHPYMTDVRISLINEYFDVVSSFDSANLTSDQVRTEYRARLMALAEDVIQRKTAEGQSLVDQRTLLAYFKRAQVHEDAGDYVKAIADYESARKAAANDKVRIKGMSSYLAFRLAQCYYWQFRAATDATQRENLRVQAANALADAAQSKDLTSPMTFGRQVEFLQRELKPPEAFLQQAPQLAPREPVAMEPVQVVVPPTPDPAPAVAPVAPTEGAAPAAPAGAPPAEPAPMVPAAPPAPTEPAPATNSAPTPAPAPDKPAGGGWLP